MIMTRFAVSGNKIATADRKKKLGRSADSCKNCCISIFGYWRVGKVPIIVNWHNMQY